MRLPQVEKVLLGVVLTAALASIGWFGWRGKELARLRRPVPLRKPPIEALYQASGGSSPSGRVAEWNPPVGQSRGPEWVYELFTPPDVFYDQRAEEFSVMPRDAGEFESGAKASDPIGLELIAVKRVPYPLRLMGYLGSEGHLVGSFEKTGTGEVFLAEAGQMLPAMDLEIVALTVQRRLPATAVVTGPSAGTKMTLTAGERSYTDELVAVVALRSGETETIHELREGDELEGGGLSYSIEQLGVEPALASIVVVSAASSESVRIELRPRTSSASEVTEPDE